MAKNKKLNGLLPLALGVLILLVGYNVYGDMEGRETRVRFDGDATQDFRLTILDFPATASIGSEIPIDVRVHNMGRTGSMYVQCSILDKDVHGWLDGYARGASVDFLPEESNCVAGEPFTQTAQVYLEQGKQTELTFHVITPNIQSDNAVVFCDAFEQCYSPNAPYTFSTDTKVEPITIRAASNGPPPPPPPNGNGDGSWVRDNLLLVLLAGFALVLIGLLLVFKEPKQPKTPVIDRTMFK